MGEAVGHGWGEDDVVAQYATCGFSDQGEAEALRAAGDVRRGHVLDLGVGGGRTTGLLAPHAASYVGIDLAPEMVELARSSHAGVDLRVGDAADLSDLPSGRFDLVVFSFNGLDALDHDGRVRSLREMARVLAPAGRLVVSSLNRDGVSFDERPWRMRGRRPREVAVEVARVSRHPGSLVTGLRNYRHTRRQCADRPGWSLRPMRAHEFRFVVHFAPFGATVELLGRCGLAVEAAWSDQGTPLDPTATDVAADYMHYLCRRQAP